MNDKEIDYNLLEVEKGNKRNGIYLKNHIQDQKKEIDRLYENNLHMQEEMARTWEKYDNLQSRIDKAIEYIEKKTKETDFDNDKLIDILDILKGSDNRKNR